MVKEVYDSALVEDAPHPDSPDEANKLRGGCGKPDCPRCALMEGAVWLSQLCFSGNFNQRRQAEDNRQFDYQKARRYSACGFTTIDIGIAGGHPNRVGAETEKEKEPVSLC